MKFALMTLGAAENAKFGFQLWNTGHLKEQYRILELTDEDVTLLNPNTRTCPIFKSELEAEVTKSVYRRVPV